MRFAGKVCLVTGAARGIGAAIATAFAEEGATVVMTDVLGDELAQRADALKQFSMPQNVSGESDWQAVISEISTRYGRLDILVNNAGYGWLRKITETSLEDWQQLMAVNVNGVFLGMKHGIPLMAASGGGAIINMSSMYGTVGNAGSSAYCASKGAVTMMTKAVALECAEANNGIRVNSIHPGYVMTPSVRSTLTPEQIEVLRQKNPLNRLADAEEIARATLFLASPDSSFMTGAELHVDGGFTSQ